MLQPDYCTDEMLVFLDNLRESGVTNMFGAGSYVEEEFPELNRTKARMTVSYWMDSFASRHPEPAT